MRFIKETVQVVVTLKHAICLFCRFSVQSHLEPKVSCHVSYFFRSSSFTEDFIRRIARRKSPIDTAQEALSASTACFR